ncbi:hypothetical protein Cgig2_008815 [Carnegiea gigantea]|uniref:THO complex subunit 1 n=1 Tax=Carnegiea gigantea TaxID=171969 RepID=A0A9Q1GKK6_9CARY|nr:hypothetical protein Cgig2_008815 [Carnegiea gigantea]
MFAAVNIKGVFNTSNETKYEKEAPDGISIDFNFYKTFWSLQEYFYSPPSLTLNPTKWHRFTSSLAIVLNTFEAQPLSDEEGNANNFEEEGASFNIKYLTSSKLMGLELKDPSFRHHVLVQCLILFDYLKTPGKSDKDFPSEAMKEEIKSYEERVKKLLESTPPKGKEFLNSVEHILEREKNWAWWKHDGCPPFEKQAVVKKSRWGKETGSTPGTSFHYLPVSVPSFVDLGCISRPRWRLGNKGLSQLWKWADQNPNALTDPDRVRVPPISDYWNPLAEDMDPSTGIEAEYHQKNNKEWEPEPFDRWAQNMPKPWAAKKSHKDECEHSLEFNMPKFSHVGNVYCWKGLRFSARQDLEGFSQFTKFGIEGVVPLELLPPEVRSKYEAKPNEKSKRAKNDETKGSAPPSEDNQSRTPASEMGGDGGRTDLEAPAAPMDMDSTPITGNNSQGGTPEEPQKQSSETPDAPEAGQLETDADAEPGMIDGETDADVDLEQQVDPVLWGGFKILKFFITSQEFCPCNHL